MASSNDINHRRRGAKCKRNNVILFVIAMSFLWLRYCVYSMGVFTPQIIKPTLTTDYKNNDDDDDSAQSSLTEFLAPQNNYNITFQSSVNQSLAVISVCIPGGRFNTEYIDASLSNKQYFCDKWGVTCILSRERMHPENNPTYSPKWEKLFSINKTMHATNADWLMWLDCDAAFTNLDIDWRMHLDGYLDKSKVLLASKDENGINLGVFLVPNTPYSRFFIEMMLEERHDVERKSRGHKDQNALKNLLKKSSQLERSIDDSVPKRMINSVSFKSAVIFFMLHFLVNEHELCAPLPSTPLPSTRSGRQKIGSCTKSSASQRSAVLASFQFLDQWTHDKGSYNYFGNFQGGGADVHEPVTDGFMMLAKIVGPLLNGGASCELLLVH